MRERGDLSGFTGTGNEGATATESVAACICPGLRRQYAIRITAFTCGPRMRPALYYLVCPRAKQHPFGQRNARFRTSGRSLTPNRRSSDQIGGSRRGIHPAPVGPMVTTKTLIKAKARTNVRALANSTG